ncbi:hypothetical protein V6Z11_A05G151000 [Gossypium hirsutum]
MGKKGRGCWCVVVVCYWAAFAAIVMENQTSYKLTFIHVLFHHVLHKVFLLCRQGSGGSSSYGCHPL